MTHEYQPTPALSVSDARAAVFAAMLDYMKPHRDERAKGDAWAKIVEAVWRLEMAQQKETGDEYMDASKGNAAHHRRGYIEGIRDAAAVAARRAAELDDSARVLRSRVSHVRYAIDQANLIADRIRALRDIMGDAK